MVILVLALFFLGPQRIPEVASSLGKAIRSFRKATRELQDQIHIDDEVRRPLEELRSALRDEPARFRDLMNPATPLPPSTAGSTEIAVPIIAPVPHTTHPGAEKAPDEAGPAK